MQITRAEQFRWWLPALVWATAILSMSGSAGNSMRTGGLVRFLFPDLGEPIVELINVILRKLGHVGAYGLLGYLNFRGIRGGRRGWTARWSALATLLAVAVASLDEFRQSFDPTRTGSPSDVLLDSASAAAAQVLLWIRSRHTV